MNAADYSALCARLQTKIGDTVTVEVARTVESVEAIISTLAGELGEYAFDKTGSDDFVSDLGLSIVGN